MFFLQGCTPRSLCYTLEAMRKWFVNGVICAVCATLAVGPVVYAAPSPAPSPPTTPGQGLEISPPVIQLTANPGQTITTQIRLRDVTQGELIAKGEVDDFGAGNGEDGTPKLLLDETGSTRYSLKQWVGAVPNVVLAPQQLVTNTITIHVPANAEPGGHYGVIRFTGVPPDLQGTGVALAASVGSLILLRVNGAITDNLSMVEFSTYQKGLKGAFFEAGPVDFVTRLKNAGSVHELAKGNITVKNWLGKSVAVLNVNPNGGNVLPDSIRRFKATLSQRKLFGEYTATASLKYAGNKPLSAKMSFWIIPWKLLLLALLGLVVLGYLIKIAVRRYNEHIIAMARRR
jgi:hypothetical protein